MKRDIATEIKAFLSDERKMLEPNATHYERPQEKSLVVIE
jgi:hypothetical protein